MTLTRLNKLGDRVTDFELKVAGDSIAGLDSVNKFGKATNCDSAVITDVWDGANATDDIAVWVAPTLARKHTLVSTDATDTCGFNTLTLTGLPLDTETVVIGTKTYTFQTTLTDVDGNVLIGANASDSIDNLIAAIELTGTPGTVYAASMTQPAESVLATVGAGDTMIVYDLDSESLATIETLTNGSFNAATVTAGIGARKVQIYGLKDWDTKEISEIITLNGAVGVNTINDYVIIHRMKVISYGTTGPNAGVISCTAATDSTLTAQINATEGQTLMAIYGIPSTQCLYVTKYYASALKAQLAVAVQIDFDVNPIPDVNPNGGTVTKHTIGLVTTGSTSTTHEFNPYFKITGPAYIKMHATTTSANTIVSAGFDAYLVDNT